MQCTSNRGMSLFAAKVLLESARGPVRWHRFVG